MGNCLSKQSVRVLAAQVIRAVSEQHRSLTPALADARNKLKKQDEGALLQEMCYGSLRWFYRFDAIIADLLNKPLKERDQDIFYLLVVGLYQLQSMKIPPHAVVQETVNAVAALKKAWAKGLVNALLRQYQRKADEFAQRFSDDEEALYAHPQWLIETLRHDWPQQYESILEANNQRPPMVLRVNQQRCSVDEYRQRLQDVGLQSELVPAVMHALRLEKPVAVSALPDFDKGFVSVQDGAAQLAAQILDAQPAMHVLDACAAPGGKTLHILESSAGPLSMVALDHDSERLQSVRENLDRLGFDAQLITGDAQEPDKWWDGQPFQRILLDVPCSGTGVIRRHPDIKLLRNAADIDKLVLTQANILNAVWPLLAPGGMLVYSTCSVIKQENELQVRAFLDSTADANEIVIHGDWGHTGVAGKQVLPGESGMDGFFYACLTKTTII